MTTSLFQAALYPQAVLRVEHISKRFGGVKVFDDISFSLAPGEILGVIGPNGAGKTTLINVVSGQIASSAGRIRLGDCDLTATPFHARSHLGLVRSFQQTKTFKTASVRENIERALRFSGGQQNLAVDRIDTLLEKFDLLDRLDHPSDTLPYGLQKMLGLLLVYAASPKVLLLDEPAAGLEEHERGRIDTFVHDSAAHLGCGVLIVEHDMDLIRRLCPRILVLDGGRILADGRPEEVLARRDVIEAYLGTFEDEGTTC